MDNNFQTKSESKKQKIDLPAPLSPTLPKFLLGSNGSGSEQGSLLQNSDNQLKKKLALKAESELNNVSGNLESEMNNEKKLQQFADAWKSESNFSILLIEKLSLIVKNYFKVMTQVEQKNDQIGLLIVYNKSLYEILAKFQDQQKKLVHKLRTMEDFNMKAMRQLCILKKRQFTPIEKKPQQLLFSKFSLKALKYEKPEKQCQHPDEDYKVKMQTLFKKYLLQKNDHHLPQVAEKISQREEQLKTCEKNIYLQLQNAISDLKQLHENIINYNKGIANVNSDNMFDLYELKWEIKTQMKNLDMEIVEDQDAVNRERMFVNNVKTIHADLTSMKEGELQNYLKKQKEIRKTMKRQRVKEQEIFLRNCEEAQSENVDLKEEIRKQKDRILQLEEELSQTKAEMEFRSMRKIMKSNNSQMLDDSNASEGDKILSSKKLKDGQLRRLKQENQKLAKNLAQKNREAELYEKEKKTISERIRANGIDFEQNTQMLELIQLVLYYYNIAIESDDKAKQKKSGGAFLIDNKEQQLVSPKLDQKQIFGFNSLTNEQFLKRPPIQKSLQSTQRISSSKFSKTKPANDQQLQSLRQQFESMKQQLQQIQIRESEKDLKIQRLQSEKRLDTETIKTLQKSIKILKEQIEDKQRELQQKVPNLEAKVKQLENLLEKQINSKIERVKELTRQIEALRNSYKKLNTELEQIKYEKVCAEKLAGKITKSVEMLVNQDISSDKFLLMADKMFQNLQTYVDQYNKETNKNLRFGTQFEVQGVIAQKNYDHKYMNYEYKMKKQVAYSQSDSRSGKASIIKNKEPQNNDFIKSSISKSNIQKQKSDEINKSQSHSQSQIQLQQKTSSKQQKQARQQKQSPKQKQISYSQLHSNTNSKIYEQLNRKQTSMQSFDSKKPNQIASESESMVFEDFRKQKRKLKNQEIDECKDSIQFKNDVPISNDKKGKQKGRSQLSSPPTLPKRDKKQSMTQSMINNSGLTNNQKLISVEEECLRQYERMKGKGFRKKSKSKNSESSKQVGQSSSLHQEFQQKKIISQEKIEKLSQHLGSSHRKFEEYRTHQPEKYIEKEQNDQRVFSDQKYQAQVNKKSKKVHTQPSAIKLAVPGENGKHEKQQKLSIHRPAAQDYKSNARIEDFFECGNDSHLKNSRGGWQKQGKNSKRSFVASNLHEDGEIVELDVSSDDDSGLHLKPKNQDKAKNTVMFSLIDNSAIDAGVEIAIVERMQQKLRRLYNDEDALDFYQLFHRYKQALKCLERAEQLNKFLELRYQKFIQAVKHKQEVDPSYDIHERLLYLQRNALQQQEQLIHQKQQFENSVIEQIKYSQKVIDEQMKLLKKEQKKAVQ